MRTLPSDSFDAMLTDPPAGIGFMGRSWDSNKGGRDEWIAWLAAIMREAYRCLKPGAHGLVWALPRTSHWTAMALEDAGFEIRDSVFHIFGSGFPKSLNASKAIDAMNGDERPVHGVDAEWIRRVGVTHDSKSYTDACFGSVGPNGGKITSAGSSASAAFEGYGTSLKPAAEVWWLIRKPMAGTVAANLLEHGTGCLAIDACRIGQREERELNRGVRIPDGYGFGAQTVTDGGIGRWPAHLILDEEAGRILDAQAGECPSATNTGPTVGGKVFSNGSGITYFENGAPYRGDTGTGPSRFFYTAKCSTSERNLGCEDLPMRSAAEVTDRNDGDAALDSPRTGAGRTGGARNIHPTIKSSSLTRWLARLIKPPGDNRRMLNPFTGSGGEAIGAILEGYAHVECIEREPEYFEIAKRRIAHAEENPRAWEPDADRSPDDVLPGQIPLFGDAAQ